MNHLCGLPDLSNTLADTSAEERAVLAQFRAAYVAMAPDGVSEEPAATIDSSALPDSGWRALDDLTLWRFLTADQRKGKFNQEASLQRLRQTLSWRRQHRIDDLLRMEPLPAYIAEGQRLRPRTIGEDPLFHGKAVTQFERIGEFIHAGNHRNLTPSQWMLFEAYSIERLFMVHLRGSAARSGVPVRYTCYIADLSKIFSSM